MWSYLEKLLGRSGTTPAAEPSSLPSNTDIDTDQDTPIPEAEKKALAVSTNEVETSEESQADAVEVDGAAKDGENGSGDNAERSEPVTKPEATTTIDEKGGGENAEEVDEDAKYLKGAKLTLLSTGLLLATFVVALDNTILATAIPRITTVFDSLNDVGWYGSAYLLTTTSLQPTFGKIYTYFDVKWVYLSGLLTFELGSIICAAATSSSMLIIGRAIAGAGAASLFSGSMTIIGYSVPLRKRAIYIAMLSSTFGIASVVGPILGGAFTDRVSWRWCFWINLPFGGISSTVVFLFFSNPPRPYATMTVKDKIKQMDLAGAFFLICGIVCLLLALQWGGSVYPWSNSKVWGCLLGSGLIINIFIGLQLYLGDRATMPPRILAKQRTVTACAMFSAFQAMALYTHIYFLPFYFQAVKGTSAEGSGIRCIPYLVSMTLSSLVIGACITVIGPYNPPMWFGGVVFAVGCGMIYTLKPSSSPGAWIGYQILSGVGGGACVQIPFIAVQVVLNEKDMPIGNAIAIFFNTLGGALSVSVAQNIFSNTLIKQLPKLAPSVDPSVIISAGASHIRQAVSAEVLPGVIEAYNSAITRAFILPIAASGLAFLASLMMEYKSVKGKKLEPGGAA